jgi:hypothetical protein
MNNIVWASTCSQEFSFVARKINSCAYFSSEDNCEQYVYQYLNLNQLYQIMTVFLFNKNMLDPILTGQTDHDAIHELQGRDIEHYLHDYFDRDTFLSSLQMKLTKREQRRIKMSTYMEFIRSIDQQFKKYFLRYVNILSQEVPWEELQRLKEGLTLSEIIQSTLMLDNQNCSTLLFRHQYRITIDQLAAEVLNTFFRFKIGAGHQRNSNTHSTSIPQEIQNNIKYFLDTDYNTRTKYDEFNLKRYRKIRLKDYFNVRSIIINDYKFTVITNRAPYNSSCLVLNHRPGCVPYGKIVFVEKQNGFGWSNSREICKEKLKTYHDWSNQCVKDIQGIAAGLF